MKRAEKNPDLTGRDFFYSFSEFGARSAYSTTQTPPSIQLNPKIAYQSIKILYTPCEFFDIQRAE